MIIDNEYIRSNGEQHEQIIEKCSHCFENLYKGQEVIIDMDNNYFCDEYCARNFYDLIECIL